MDHEVHASEILFIRKEIFLAPVVEVGDSSHGYKVETGGDDLILEDIAGKNCDVMTSTAEMLGDS